MDGRGTATPGTAGGPVAPGTLPAAFPESRHRWMGGEMAVRPSRAHLLAVHSSISVSSILQQLLSIIAVRSMSRGHVRSYATVRLSCSYQDRGVSVERMLSSKENTSKLCEYSLSVFYTLQSKRDKAGRDTLAILQTVIRCLFF